MTLATTIVSGCFTTLTTAIIVFGANWLARKSIEQSNLKALNEMKLQVEASHRLARELERKNLEVNLKREWIREVTESFARFYNFGVQLTIHLELNDDYICIDKSEKLFERVQNEVFVLASLFYSTGNEYESLTDEVNHLKREYFNCLNKLRRGERFVAPNMEKFGKLFEEMIVKENKKIFT